MIDRIIKEFESENTKEKRYKRAIKSRYNPDKEFWVTANDIIGSFAKWAIKQSPYLYPDKLITVIKKLSDHIEIYFAPENSTCGMRKFQILELEDFIEGNLKTIPEFLEWNNRKNGIQGHAVITRYSSGKGYNPDNDFVDLDALYGNITHDIYLEIPD